jgi:hypothetical protein
MNEYGAHRFRGVPARVENAVTGGMGYESQGLPPKGSENYLSFQIHLGSMDKATKGISPETATELRELETWRGDILRAGVERFIGFNNLKRFTEALGSYRATPKPEMPKPIIIQPEPSVIEDATKYRRLKGIAVNTGRVAASATAAVALSASAFFLGRGLVQERDPLFDQISLTANQHIELTRELKKAETPEEKVMLEGQLEQVHSHRELVWDELDKIDYSPEQYGLYGSLLGTLAVLGTTAAFVAFPKRYNPPSQSRRI